MTNPFLFDNSLLSTTYCTTRAVLRHVHHFTTERDELRTNAGKAAHEALAAYFKGAPIDNCIMVFAERYDSDPTDCSDRLSYGNTSTILRRWLEEHPLDAFPFEVIPDLVEIPFSLPLSDECVCGHGKEDHSKKAIKKLQYCFTCKLHCGADLGVTEGYEHGHPSNWPNACCCKGYKPAYIFTGRIDAIVRDKQTGWLRILDHKTSSRLDVERYRNDSQMSGYIYAANRLQGEEVKGAYINLIRFALLPGMKGNGHYKCRTHKRKQHIVCRDGVEYDKERAATYDECREEHAEWSLDLKTRTPEQLETWRLSALSMAKEFRATRERYATLESVNDAPMEGMFFYNQAEQNGNGCQGCTFQDFCGSGRIMEFAESMLVRSEWSPLK